jgi:hypothetical protein
MAALDACEPQIIRALHKQGWQILEKPYMIRTEIRSVYADFSLQKQANGRRELIIVCEVKCFTQPQADLQEFYTAIGQYRYYLNALRSNGITYPLYLAIPHHAYLRLVQDKPIKRTLDDPAINLVIVDIDKEEVTQWIPSMKS